jgi:hypothetical protein
MTGTPNGKKADPGMAGSLLYHMAMVTKMEGETQVLLKELNIKLPNINPNLKEIYSAFESDAKELTKTIGSIPLKSQIETERPSTKEKIELFRRLKQKNKIAENLLNQKDSKAADAIQHAFLEWTRNIIKMRLIQ